MTKPRLLSLARASAEISAGVPGRCAICVRVLDDVTLRIHAGELLLACEWLASAARAMPMTMSSKGAPNAFMASYSG